MSIFVLFIIGIINVADSVCHPFWCTSIGMDCLVADNEACTCTPGWEARETGDTIDMWFVGKLLSVYECCSIGTGGAVGDGTCYGRETDSNGCTQQKCTSPSTTEGDNCWAGTEWEGCTCDDGWEAVETGVSGTWNVDGKMYYEYTCCPSGGTTDGTCGDFIPIYKRWYFFLVMGVIVVSIVSCIICCCRGDCCCGEKQRRAELSPQRRAANPPSQVEMVMTNPPPPVAISEGMNPQQPQSVLRRISAAGTPLSPKHAESAPQVASFVLQAPQQGVPRVVMGQNGQWIIQQPQWVQQSQQGMPQQGMAQQQAPQGTVQRAVGQNGQWVMQQPQEIEQVQPEQGVAQLVSTEQVKAPAISPMQRFQYVRDERQIAEGDKAQWWVVFFHNMFAYNYLLIHICLKFFVEFNPFEARNLVGIWTADIKNGDFMSTTTRWRELIAMQSKQVPIGSSSFVEHDSAVYLSSVSLQWRFL